MAVNWAVSIVLDTAVVNSDEQERIIREMLKIVRNNTKTVATATWSAGGTPNILATVTA